MKKQEIYVWKGIWKLIRELFLFIPRKIFIAGRTQEEALAIAEKLNDEGFLTTIDILGEHSKSEEEVETALREYKQLVSEIRDRDLKSTISIKLTHLGLELGFGDCFNVVKDLVGYARRNNVVIEFDMEEFKYNHDTIEIFQSLSKPADNNRICLQANIFKSVDDLIMLHDKGFQIRLVKGAYEENSDVALYHQFEINKNFCDLVSTVILQTVSNKNSGICRPQHAIGTRDQKIIDWAKNSMRFHHLDKHSIEFQLLYGYLALGRELLQEGYPVRIYLPYGDDQTAFPYILRRLKSVDTWKLFFDWLFNFSKTRK